MIPDDALRASSDQGQSSSSGSDAAAPAIQLPKGGGAIRGIGEKVAANPVTGTGSMSVPIATSPGRSGFGPQLSLSYDSGAGNGPFGFGWSLSLPSITRKTDKGLPQYFDAVDSDVFILSGAEDLVPVYRQDPDGTWVAGRQGFRRDADGFWVRDPSGRLVVHEDDVDGYRVRRYRPRIEGLFARIERWSKIGSPGDVHWRSISKDNILTLYGHDTDSRIVDPLDASRIFSWLICESRDDKGNGIRYLYKKEDGDRQLRPGQADPFNQIHQRNRGLTTDSRRTAQRYLQRVLYGAVKPLLDAQGVRPRDLSDLPNPPSDTDADWLFEVRFDYGELDEGNPTGQPEKLWLYRPDAFSSYRSGFEVRTCRRCERVLMLHHIPDKPAVPGQAARHGYRGVVRSTEFTYDDEIDPGIATQPVYSFLKQVVQTGWKQEGGSTTRRSLPPVEFTYTVPIVQDVVEEVDPASLENLPIGLDGSAYRWTDLHGEGIPGILTEQAGAWFYKRNWSPIPQTQTDGSEAVKARFAPLETVALTPNVALNAGAEFMDLAGDGQPDVVVMEGPTPGLYEHDRDEGWQPFRPFTSRLNRDFRDPNLEFVDLDGDGRADVLMSENEAFVWHASLAEDGFGPARRVTQALDEEKGPRIVFADGTQSIYLADLSGDGLTDIVRIRNGEVCYWPNLGYGRFGAKVTMDSSPWFDNPDQFDHKRIRLADIDGSGTTDIIYLHRDGVRLHFNQSGNGWSQPQVLKVFPRVDDLVSIVPTDLLGNGTACLVWSSPLPGDAQRPMRYVNLMGGRKPHLLVKSINNLGAETRVDYAPSTKFYLQDKRDGKPWITRLPFPVHVVERVETCDHISRNRFVTRYAYHHGHFDGEEREFRGFGMVEQWDTEQFTALADGAAPAENIDAASHVPPVHTKTWFHTGAATFDDETRRRDYFSETGLTPTQVHAMLLPDTVLPTGLAPAEEREAARALKGSMLRSEVYADDAAPGSTPEQVQRARRPYVVTEQNFTVETLQHRDANRHSVFFTHPRETVTYHYDRSADDPRVQHALTLQVDEYGNVLKQAAIGYGRRHADTALPTDEDRTKQRLILITATENTVTNAILGPAAYRAPMPADSRTYELRKPHQDVAPDGPTVLYPFDAVRAILTQAGDDDHGVAYEDLDFSSAQADPAQADKYFRRQIDHSRTLYRSDDLSRLLPLRTLETLALSGESYQLAFTATLLEATFQRPRPLLGPENLLPNPSGVLGSTAGGYLLSKTAKDDGRFPADDPEDRWWLPSGRIGLSTDPTATPAAELAEARLHFYLPRRYQNPFGYHNFVDYDHDLMVAETRDALDNRVTAVLNDYRVLQPRVIRDPNRNETEVAFDTLGMVVGTAIIGKSGATEGDSLTSFIVEPTAAQLHDLATAPREPAGGASQPTAVVRQLLGGASTRFVYDLDRFRRTQADNPADNTKWEPTFAASIVRETHLSALAGQQLAKLQISFSYSDGFGREIQRKAQAEPGPLSDGGAVVNPRWVGSGWIIYNNKCKPVRQYEPFFSATHEFEFAAATGVSPILFYDPVDRLVATLYPNHTYDKTLFDPWQQATYDTNDTSAQRNNQTGDPRTDPDIGGYVAAYFTHLAATNPAQPWQTWYAQRATGGLGALEQSAAIRAADHADTPSTTYFDTLGRPFMTRSRNRVVCNGHALNGTEDSFYSRIDLDIEGNQRTVRDAVNQAGDPLGRIVMRYNYNMLGARVQQSSMEAGDRWILNDVTGNPIRTWDSRGHNFTTGYDELRRPITRTVRGTTADSDPRTAAGDVMIEKLEYGEPPSTASAADKQRAIALNLRTRLYRHRDPAGVVTNAALDANDTPIEAFDFKGNLLSSTRRFTVNYTDLPNWQGAPQLEDESYAARTRYDALNRPIQTVAPHSSKARAKRNITQPTFNDANLLERVDVWLELNDDPTTLIDPSSTSPSRAGVTNIDYDAKGQRQHIDYKNDTSTHYSYDSDTFRLVGLYTRRGAAYNQDCDNPLLPPPDTIAAPPNPPPGKRCGVQNLHYTYDPVGNITHIRDDAQQTLFFRNQRVDPSNDYVYDALYRLIQATGREHLGQLGGAPRPPTPPNPFNTFHIGLAHPGDSAAMGTYTEQYVYDAVGNFKRMQHRGSQPVNAGWTVAYDYAETSLIETGTAGTLLKTSNRLSSTQLSAQGPAAPYHYDPHGNTTFMQHLSGGGNDPNLGWDYADQLRQADRDLGAFYVYDRSGQRVRKIWRKSAGLTEERIYLGGSEIFRSYPGPITNSDPALERETLHVTDDRRRIALVETRTLGNDSAPRQLIRYQHDNHLGSVSVELDADARIISYEEYAPYGSSTFQAVATETPKRYRYTGKERDEETGFTYHGARFYAPWIARWVSADPSGTRSGVNLYLYVAASPTRLVDDDGMDPKPSFSEVLTKGLLEGGKVALFHTPVSPLRIVGDVQTIKQMVNNFSEEYQQSGSIGKGLLRATDVVNPAYHAATEAFETREAVDKGNYGAAAAHGTTATIHAVSTVLLAVGGARALTAPKAPITPPPALEPPTTTPAVPKPAPALEPAGQAAPAISEAPPRGTQLSLFPDEVPPSVAPETLASEAGGAPPREIPFDIDIAEVKSSNWSAQRTLDYQGKFIFTEGLDLGGGVQGAIRYTPNNTLLVNLAELGGMEKPIGGTYELALDPLEVQQATAGLKFGSSAYGNSLEAIAVRRVAKATGQSPVLRPAQQGGADFLPQQTRFRVLGF